MVNGEIKNLKNSSGNLHSLCIFGNNLLVDVMLNVDFKRVSCQLILNCKNRLK